MLAVDTAPFKLVSEKKIVTALLYGQAMSALNCGFEGARGVMYGFDKARFKREVRSILDRQEACTPTVDSLPFEVKKKAQCLCPACQATRKHDWKKKKLSK